MSCSITNFAHLALLVLLESPLAAQPVEFANARRIEIDSIIDEGGGVRIPWRAAEPYPSTIEVEGFGPGDRIAKVTVTLHRMLHDFPDDVDILLSGPEGQAIIIFSDACGDVWDSDEELTITLDDDAPDSLPDEDPIERDGAFRPKNFTNLPDDPSDLVDIFPQEDHAGSPAPHPSPRAGSALSTFAGTQPNGAWRLFVMDDEPDDEGYIAGGWSLAITVEGSQLFLRGDSNQDGAIDLSDAVWTLSGLFLGGAQPECADAADADDNGAVTLTDPIFTLDHLFRSGPAPGSGVCDQDRTSDKLPCRSPPPCTGAR